MRCARSPDPGVDGEQREPGHRLGRGDPDCLRRRRAGTGLRTRPPTRARIEIDVLNYFRTTGVAGYKADAFVALQPENEEHVKLGVDLVRRRSISGVELPQIDPAADARLVPRHGAGNAAQPRLARRPRRGRSRAYDSRRSDHRDVGPEKADDVGLRGGTPTHATRATCRAIEAADGPRLGSALRRCRPTRSYAALA